MLAPSLIVAALGLMPADPEPPTEAKVKQAVELGLVYMQDEGVDWIRNRKCGSCHHASLLIWAGSEAKARGFAVDQAALDEVAKGTLDDPVTSKVLPAPKPADAPPERADISALPTTYAALAEAARPTEGVREKLAAYLASVQKEDGSWTHGGGRPPMLESPEVATLMTVIAIGPRGDDGPAAASRKKAADWLAKNPEPGSFQARALRLLVAARSGAEPAALKAEREAIGKLQRPDGGWSQTPEMPSDAYATGQALYALMQAGATPDQPEVGRARAFLVAHQREDGTWPMTSRPIAPGGEGAKDLAPITISGSAWAVLGLVASSPK